MKKPGVKDLYIGAVIINPPTSLTNKTGSWRVIRPVIDQDRCIRCRICWAYCPDAAILELDQPYEAGEKKYSITYVVNYDYCKGCGVCAAECPVKAIKMIPEVEKL
ncbi:MAG: 4Fe-4S binding protein [Desulfurococcales archaeon]|nr:4Fe-4S binding protein [Desulfurococcales archaeon]